MLYFILCLFLTFGLPSHSMAVEINPPPIPADHKPRNINLPILISPHGGPLDNPPTFSWYEVNAVSEYVFWLADSKNKVSVVDLTKGSTPDLDCKNGVCKYKFPATVSSGEGRWAVRALGVKNAATNDTPTSKWGKVEEFGGAKTKNLVQRCLKTDQKLTGDIQGSEHALNLGFTGVARGQWSVGTTVSTQLVRYDFAKKKAALNESLGAGASFRFYRHRPIGGHKEAIRAGVAQVGGALKNEGWVYKWESQLVKVMNKVWSDPKNKTFKPLFDTAAQHAGYGNGYKEFIDDENSDGAKDRKAKKIYLELMVQDAINKEFWNKNDGNDPLENFKAQRTLDGVVTSDSAIFNETTEQWELPVSFIKTDCRQSTFATRDDNTFVAPTFSIAPTLYITKPLDDGELAVSPALLLGFFGDIVNVGVGFNLTGESGEKGNVFMLMSLGAGFQF